MTNYTIDMEFYVCHLDLPFIQNNEMTGRERLSERIMGSYDRRYYGFRIYR